MMKLELVGLGRAAGLPTPEGEVDRKQRWEVDPPKPPLERIGILGLANPKPPNPLRTNNITWLNSAILSPMIEMCGYVQT